MFKKVSFKSKFLMSTVALAGLSFGLATSVDAAQVPVQILGINDFHGALSTTGTFNTGGNGPNTSGAGTAALLAGHLNWAENTFNSAHPAGSTIRLHSGDIVGGSPANSKLLADEPTVRVMNAMNFSIGTLGNHEFDEGIDEYYRIMNGIAPENDPYGILTNYNREKSTQQVVVANVIDKETGAIPKGWSPYTIREVGVGEETTKVGFIGIATTNTPNLVLRRHVEGFDFLDEAQTIAKYSAELRAQGVNAIVVMGHVGSSSLAGIAAGDAVEIMNRVNELDANNSVDVFVAAHNHLFTNGLAGNTRIVQSTSNGRGYIDLQGTIDTQTGDFVSAPTAEVRPVAPNVGILPDNNVQAIVNEATYITNEVAARKIGRTADGQPISRTVNKARGESPVGNLITDAQRYMANVEGLNVDFAMTNNGGIRDDLRVNSLGEVTWGAAQAVQPFGNILQVIEMTGDQVERVLNQQFIGTSNLFLQISGLRYTYVETPNGPQTHEILNVTKEDGTPIVADETYRVIVNEFIYAGGDGFSVFTEAKFVEGMATDTNTFINFIELMTSRGQALSASTGDRKILVTPEVEALKNNAANILANGLSQSQLTFNNGVVTLTLDGYSFVLSENANNRNIAGTISINDQFELRFDIKGNGSNVKVFEVVEK